MTPVYFDIVSRIVGMEAEAGKIVEQATSAGTKAGTGFADAFKDKVLGTSSGMTSSMTAQVNAAATALESASARVVKAKDAEADAAGRVRVAETQLAEARQKYAADSAKVVAAEEKLEAARRKNIATSADAVAAATAEQRAQEALGAKQDQVAAKAGTLGTALKGAAVLGVGAMGLAMGEAVKSAGNFQSSQERLVTTAGESRNALKLVSDGILDMSGKVGYSAAELSKGMYTIESAGIHGADGLKVLQAAAQGARSEGADLGEVTDAVTTALHDYHLPADQAALVTSKMVTAVGDGKTTFEQFASSLASVQPLAGAAGISIDDLYGSLAAMTASGMSADRATQNMADSIRHLQNPTSIMREELSQVGIDSNNLSQNLGKNGLSGSMEQISTAILQHMGPSGTVLLNTFNQSKTAAADAQKMFDALPPSVQKVAAAVKDGSLSAAEFRKTSGGLSVEGKNLVTQWLSQENASKGFSQALKTGAPNVQTYTAALAKATGDASSMNVALMLTGENASKTAANVKDVAAATLGADGSVKGWTDTQATFNTKLAEFKDGVGATAIKIGNELLPSVTNMLGGVKDGFDWLSNHKNVLDGTLITVSAIGVAWASWKIGTGIAAGISAITASFGALVPATEAATAANAELDVAMDANPVGAIVLAVEAAIAALVGLGVGAKYAYDHFGWFKTTVDDTWHVLQKVGGWIGHEFTVAWHGVTAAVDPVEHAFGNVGHAIGNVEHAFGNVEHAIGNVMHALTVAGAVVATVIAVPFVLAFKVVEAAADFLWHNAIEPAFTGIGDVFHWIYDTIVKPVIALIKDEITGWGIVVNWLHDTVIAPVMNAIGDVWHWLHDTVVKPVIDSIKLQIQAFGDAFHWLHDTVIKPVGDAIGTVLSGMKTGFKDMVDWLDQQWSRIEGIVGPPVKFIVDTIYNEGIVPTWNAIAGVFGLSSLKTVDGGLGAPMAGGASGDAGFAGGGVFDGPGIVPGYAPGVDSHNARLSPGEGVAVPELVQAIGPANFLRLNHIYSGGRPNANGVAFAGGGIMGFDGGGIMDAVGGITDLAKDAWHGAADVAKFTAALARDPVGAVTSLFKPVLDGAASAPDGGSDNGTSAWRDMVVGMPAKFVEAVVDKAKAWLTGGGGGAAGTPFVGSPDLMGWIAQAITITGVDPAVWIPRLQTLIGRESGGNPNAINNYDSNAAAGDPSRGLMQTIGSTFEAHRSQSLPDNIYDPVANIVAGINYIKSTYGDITNVQQADASKSPKGYAGGGIAPGSAGVTSTQKALSGPEQALAQIRDHAATMYAWGGADLATGVDCTGLLGDAMQIAEGVLNPTQRIGDTTSMLAGQWPHLLSGASTSDVFAVGANKDHAAGTILGTNFEARQTGERIRIGSDAVSAWDKQFTAQFHLDPSVFNPAYTAAAATSTTSKKTNAEKAQALNNSANKALDAAKASDAAAVKHDQAATKYEDEGRKAQALADKTAGAARDKHLHAVQSYKDKAAAAHAAAEKARQEADAHRKKAADDQAKAKTTAATPDKTTKKGTSSSSSGTSGGLLTFEQAGEKAGGVAADAFLETFGLGDTLLADPNKSPLLKVAGQLGNLKIQGQPVFVNPLQHLGAQQAQNIPLVTAAPQATAIPEQLQVTTDDQLSDTLDATHDLGGLLPPGLSIVNNKLGRGEIMVSPQDQLRPAEQPRHGPGDSRPSGPLLNIEHWHQHTGGGQEDARAITRELNTFAGMQSR